MRAHLHVENPEARIAHIRNAWRVRRVLVLSGRTTLLLGGAATIGMSIAILLWNDLGPGPLDVFIGAVRSRTGLPLAVAVWTTIGSLNAIAWLMGRRPGLGTLLAPLVMGPAMQATLSALHSFERPGPLVVRLLIQLIAIGGIGIGAGALIASRLGDGTCELLAAAASDRTGRTEPQVRMGFELGLLVAGVLLGGPAGLGTVIVALLLGTSVATGSRIVDSTAARVRQWPRTSVELQRTTARSRDVVSQLYRSEPRAATAASRSTRSARSQRAHLESAA